MSGRAQTTTVALVEDMSDTSVRRLREENQLFKQLLELLNGRHTESVKYIKCLKQLNQKLLKRFSDSEASRLNEEFSCEQNLVKFDKQIDSLKQKLFSQTVNTNSVQTQTRGQSSEVAKSHQKLYSKCTDSNANSGGNGRYRCEYYGCDQLFVRKDQMETHLRVHSSMQSAIGFAEQSFEANSYDKIKDNINNSNNVGNKANEQILFVPQMELEVIYTSGADIHNNSNNNTNNESHSYSLTSEDSNSQNRSEKSLIGCDICGKQFSKHYIQSHRRSHTGVKPYKCSYGGCERTFTQTSSRNYHEKTYHRLDKYSLKCYYSGCQKQFGRQLDFQKHLTQHHRQSESTGSLCGQTFANCPLIPVPQIVLNDAHLIKAAKTRKLRRVPHRSGKHACASCGKTFAHKVALRQHEVIHGNKRFGCHYPDCQYASYWKQNLSLHLRRHHNQE